MSSSAENGRVDPADLTTFVAAVLDSLKVPGDDARTVAATMVDADLWGYETHGVFRLRQYVNRLRDGGTKAAAKPLVVAETAATAVIDGDNGLGHLAMHLATRTAISKAQTAGVGWVGVRGNNHAGPLALYVQPMADKGMAGLAAAVGSANHVPAFGGSELLLGTNPIAVAVPAAGRPPFLLDMATTVASAGKIKTLAQRGEAMPEGWMVGADGAPLTDPKRQSEGFLLPIGGPKGYGLALAIALLAGSMNGAATGKSVVDFTNDTAQSANTGQFVAALSLSAFGDAETILADAARLCAELEASATLPGHDAVRIPGAERAKLHGDRLANGLPLRSNLRRVLDDIAHERGISTLATA
ncbi:MAG: Ldh family oxidoreductase [Pseudomonadota bacterium]